MRGFKIFTHDLRPPIQGGEPVWNGKIPFELPAVKLDESVGECGAGWNFVKDIKTGLKIAGMWPTGRPSRVFSVEATGKVVERSDKIRTDKLTVLAEVSDEEINAAIYDFSKAFVPHDRRMAESQIKWRRALSRPNRNEKKVEDGLTETLEVRGLKWKLKKFDSARDAWAARAVWAAWDARDAWDAWAAWASRDAWAAWAAWDARDAWAAWAARDAWDALTVEYSALKKWTKDSPELFTRGILSSYENGLGITIPTGESELGWAMEEKR